MKIKNKKAEITTQQLIIIIILIASFAVILFFISRLNLKGISSESQICHNSVVMKAATEGFVGKLDCKTNYICISGGGKCDKISATTTIKVNPDNKEEIIKAIADEMVNCWWMFGEGEINYLGISDKEALASTTCAICSIIDFDDEILEKNYKISYREFYEYLNENNKDESQSYLEYLYDSSNVDELKEKVFLDIDNNFILDNSQYAIVTGFKSGALWGVVRQGNYIIYPSYLKLEQINLLGCSNFVTKA
jgi:hypothetical protein